MCHKILNIYQTNASAYIPAIIYQTTITLGLSTHHIIETASHIQDLVVKFKSQL